MAHVKGTDTKHVIVTGGASGIGAATVNRLIEKQCMVTVIDVSAPQRSDVNYIQCDLNSASEIDALSEQLPNDLAALINVAGVSNNAPVDVILGVNFLGLRQLASQLMPKIKTGGSIVNVASSAGYDWKKRQSDIAGLMRQKSFADGRQWLDDHQEIWQQNPYKFSKQCAAAYTYIAAGEAMKHGVRVNCVNPGSTHTQLTADFRTLVGDELYDWGVSQVGREGRPEDIAEVLEFLAIGECGWLNGVELAVDGGYIAGLVGGWIDPSQAPK